MKLQSKSILAARSPRISINKLAEYIEATSPRHKQIVLDAKYPENFKTTRYKVARDAAKAYLISHGNDTIIDKAVTILNAAKTSSTFQEQDKRLSLESLQSLCGCDLSRFKDCNISTHDNENELINIHGLDISVNPDLIIKKDTKKGILMGALKIHLSKNNVLSTESQKIVGVMLYKYTCDYLATHKEFPAQELCVSMDLFAQTFESCPASFKQRMTRIEAACEEILLWWDKL